MNLPRTHLQLHLQRLITLVQLHLRAYAPRLVDHQENYTDRAVGRGELLSLLGLPIRSRQASWVDELGLPSESALRARLVALETQRQSVEEDARGSAVRLPLSELAQRLQLDPIERDLLFAAVGPALTVELARLYPVAWADFGVKQAPAWFLSELVALAHDVAPLDVLARLEGHCPLVRWRLVHLSPSVGWVSDTPLMHTHIEVPERLLRVLRGVPFEEGLRAGLVLHGRHDAPRLDEVVIDEPARQSVLDALLGQKGAQVRLLLSGAPGVGRLSLLRAIMADRPVLEVHMDAALADESAWTEVLREALLQRALLFLRGTGTRPGGPLSACATLAASYPGPIVLAVDDAYARTAWFSDLFPDLQRIGVPLPSAAGQERLWRTRLDGWLGLERSAQVSRELASRQRLTPMAMDHAMERLLGTTSTTRHAAARLTTDALLKEARQSGEHQLGALADIMSTSLRLQDVVLPEDVRVRVREVLAYANHADTVYGAWGFAEKSPQGHGLGVLFSGPPGTGKTLLATVLASELGRVLYRIDLSRIVDKYIGETEKNLGRVFDEAERAQAVLLFDEADSLFAKRTDVKSSNDRYANLEVNFLLQRLEAYSGVSILTTNLVTSLDEAFQRRLRFRIEIPMPDAERRAELWEKLLPPRAPRAANIDWRELGERFVISGGHIKNAVLRAAVLAAERGQLIDDSLLTRSGHEECREMGMVIREVATTGGTPRA